MIGTTEEKYDRLDGSLLPRICRADMIADCKPPSEDIRKRGNPRLAIAGSRSQTARETQRVQERNPHLPAKYGISYDRDPFSSFGVSDVRATTWSSQRSPEGAGGVSDGGRHPHDQIHQLEALSEKTAIARDEIQLMMTIPGVSFFSSVLIAGEISEVDRFDRTGKFVNYAGLDPPFERRGDSLGGRNLPAGKRGASGGPWFSMRTPRSILYRITPSGSFLAD